MRVNIYIVDKIGILRYHDRHVDAITSYHWNHFNRGPITTRENTGGSLLFVRPPLAARISAENKLMTADNFLQKQRRALAHTIYDLAH